MTGFHEVKLFVFKVSDLEEGVMLPDNWKPFTSEFILATQQVYVLARRWHRRSG